MKKNGTRKVGFSVVIPNYNRTEHLIRAVNSVLTQTYFQGQFDNLEIIVVDDGSDPEKFAYTFDKFNNSEVVRIIRYEDNHGPSFARNRGVESARGEFISFLDSDDVWPLDRLEFIMTHFRNSEVDIVSGLVNYKYSSNIKPVTNIFNGQTFCTVSVGACVAKSSVFKKGLFFDEKLVFGEDIDWWYRARESKLNIIFLEATTMIAHLHGKNLTSNKDFKDFKITNVLYESLKRRKRGIVPQLSDFRIHIPDPLVSIVLLCFENTMYHKDTILSIIRQNYKHWELILIGDHGNIDDQWLYPFEYRHKRIDVEQFERTQLIKSACKKANGELVVFIDQDETLEYDFIYSQWQYLRVHPYKYYYGKNDHADGLNGILIRSHALKNIFQQGDETIAEEADILAKLQTL